MLHANFTALSSIQTELLPIVVLHCRNRKLRAFCCCDLELDPMTFIDELDPYPLKISPQVKKGLSTSRHSKVIYYIRKYKHTDIQRETYREIPSKTLPRRFASSNRSAARTEKEIIGALDDFSLLPYFYFRSKI